MPPSCALLGGFTIGAPVALLWQHNANRSYNLAFVSDIAVFVLKRDVKLQPTNKLASTSRYDNIVRTRNVSECSALALSFFIAVDIIYLEVSHVKLYIQNIARFAPQYIYNG